MADNTYTSQMAAVVEDAPSNAQAFDAHGKMSKHSSFDLECGLNIS